MDTHLSLDASGPQLFWPNIVRAVGQAVILAPLAGIATAGIERRFAATASALFNMTRNLGGAIGIAALETLLTKREQFHSNILSAAVSDLDEATRLRIAQLTHYFASQGADVAFARHEAIVATKEPIERVRGRQHRVLSKKFRDLAAPLRAAEVARGLDQGAAPPGGDLGLYPRPVLLHPLPG